MSPQRSRVEMIIATNHNLPVGPSNLDHKERRSSSHAKALPLTYCEVVNASMLPDYFSFRGHQLARSIRQRFPAFGEGGIDETLVIAPRNKANLLRIRLFRQC